MRFVREQGLRRLSIASLLCFLLLVPAPSSRATPLQGGGGDTIPPPQSPAGRALARDSRLPSHAGPNPPGQASFPPPPG